MAKQTQMTAIQERLAQWAVEAASSEEVTLHVGNIPSSAKKSELMRWVDESGFAGTYDFFYLPRNFATGQNSGYAFINFVEAASARRFKKEMQGCELTSGCNLAVMSSSTQGLVENLVKWARARARRVKDPEVLPFVRGLSELGAANPAQVLMQGLGAPEDDAVPLPACLSPRRSTSKVTTSSKVSTRASTPDSKAATAQGSVANFAPGRSAASSSSEPMQMTMPAPRYSWAETFDQTAARAGGHETPPSAHEPLLPAARAAHPSAVVLWRFSA